MFSPEPRRVCLIGGVIHCHVVVVALCLLVAEIDLGVQIVQVYVLKSIWNPQSAFHVLGVIIGYESNIVPICLVDYLSLIHNSRCDLSASDLSVGRVFRRSRLLRRTDRYS